MRETEKYATLRAIFHSTSSCFRRNFRQCRPSILNCSQGLNLLRVFKFITGRFLPSLFSGRKGLLRNCFCVGITFEQLLSPTFPKFPALLMNFVILTFLSNLVFSPEMGDLQVGFRTPLQMVKFLDPEYFSPGCYKVK